jgi:sortase A
MGPRRRATLIALLLTGCSTASSADGETSGVTAHTTQQRPTITTTAHIGAPSAATSTVAETTTTTTLPVTLPVPQPPPEPRALEAGLALGSIEIPRIDLNSSLFEGVSLNTLDKGPGHWPGTAMPGAMGNVVIGGHRTSKARPFRHLEQLVPGDEVILTTDAGRFVYHVVRTEIVTPDSMWIVDQTNAYTATLFACHPVGSTKQRIVVFLELAA